MLDTTLPLIAGWQNFYLIVGPSAAALLGLQFVVVALVRDAPIPTSSTGVNGFTTPTIVHFATVLSIAAVLSSGTSRSRSSSASTTRGTSRPTSRCRCARPIRRARRPRRLVLPE